ncbi:MAG: NAD(+)/NADH kinase [Armatimonadetes bacterium]|nr:NAD(+)/NADH kinase [Armatimonadota bacterium]
MNALRARCASIASDREAAPLVGVDALGTHELGQADLMITFGGDGTLIRGAHICSPYDTPILGVYYGRFGFVTQCEPHEIGAALSLFFDGKATYHERTMLQTELWRAGKSVASLHSLNEAVLQRAATTRMLNFEVTVDGRFLTSYPADGVLVSTPTGSTAYNLSAGGPIIDPSTDVLVLTAITPHSLGTRPLVLGPRSVIDIRIETRGDALLSCDGQSRLQLLSGDSVTIQKSDRVTRLLTLDEHEFLNKIHDRLFWYRREPPVGD